MDLHHGPVRSGDPIGGGLKVGVPLWNATLAAFVVLAASWIVLVAATPGRVVPVSILPIVLMHLGASAYLVLQAVWPGRRHLLVPAGVAASGFVFLGFGLLPLLAALIGLVVCAVMAFFPRNLPAALGFLLMAAGLVAFLYLSVKFMDSAMGRWLPSAAGMGLVTLGAFVQLYPTMRGRSVHMRWLAAMAAILPVEVIWVLFSES